MNLTVNEASLYVHKLDKLVGKLKNTEVVLAPTMLALQPLNMQVQHHHFNLAVLTLVKYQRRSCAVSYNMA